MGKYLNFQFVASLVSDTNELSNIVEENADDPVHQAEAKAQIQLPQFNGAPDANRGEEEDEQQQVAQPQSVVQRAFY